MNKTQKAVLAAYIIVVTLMVVYPPYYLEIQGHIVRSEYSWLWKPIMYGSEYGRTPLGRIDIIKLLAELIGASLVAGAAFLFNKNKT